MLIHKNEIHKGDPQNFLSLIYSTEVLSTQFWVKKILEQPHEIETFRNVLQKSTVFDSGMFYKVPMENSSTSETVPDLDCSV